MIKIAMILTLLASIAIKKSCNKSPITVSTVLNKPGVKQNPYTLYWVSVPKETNVINYKIQQSVNNKNWSTITTVIPKHSLDTNKYSYQLPQPQTSRYYKIQSTMIRIKKTDSSTYNTEPIYIQLK